MVPIALEDSAGPERADVVGGDPLGHALQVALAIYLMPVIAIVCMIGGASIVINRASRLVSGLNDEQVQLVKPRHLPISRLLLARERKRTRVGR